jgi:hypothetical protein
MPLQVVVEHPREFVWLAADGVGLVPLLLMGLALMLPSQGLLSWPQALAFLAFGLATTVIARFSIDLLRLRYSRSLADLRHVMIAGFCWTYLVLPLLHHLLATPPNYRYITTAANFFANSFILQAGIWLAVFGVAAGVRSSVLAVYHHAARGVR